MASKDEWVKRDLWSKHDLTRLCLGFLPDEPVEWNEELQIRSNEIEQRIDEAVLVKNLPCIDPEDTQKGTHKLYGQNRYFRPVEAAQWASKHFPDFVFRDCTIDSEKPLHPRKRTTYLNTIAALLVLILRRDEGLDNQSKIIQRLLRDCSDAPGIRKTTLEQTFAEAKREFDLLWPRDLN